MSRHYFDTQYHNRAVEVVLGYDRALNYVFLTVIHANELIVYSSLDDPDAGFNQDLDYYRAKLNALGIDVPETLFREVEQDAVQGVGNRIARHYADGRVEAVC